MANVLFSKAQSLVEFIAKKPVRAQVVSHLSRELSPDEKPCAVALVQLAQDGTLHCIAAAGFVFYDPFDINGVPIESKSPSSHAMLNPQLQVLSGSEFKRLVSLISESEQHEWNSGASIPVGTHMMYFILFKEDITKVENFFAYLSFIASLLTVFESDYEVRHGGSRTEWFQGGAEKLTERESIVETLIREGLTNAEIARKLGYSESLIRQETVIIYRKLGISGRKDLVARKVERRQFGRDSIRAIIALSGIELLSPLIAIFSAIETHTL
jgi:DNA-binding CsgD family transcriptional regulator